jgi:hypothetical protein
MSAVHEEVHERAKQEREIDEHTQDVGAVLGKQQHCAKQKKNDEYNPYRRGKKGSVQFLFIGRVRMHGHEIVLCLTSTFSTTCSTSL